MCAKVKQIKLKLVKSLIGRLPRHKACVRGLGLFRLQQEVVVEDTPPNRGMIAQVAYLLKVEDL